MLVGAVPSAFLSCIPAVAPQSKQSRAAGGRRRSGTVTTLCPKTVGLAKPRQCHCNCQRRMAVRRYEQGWNIRFAGPRDLHPSRMPQGRRAVAGDRGRDRYLADRRYLGANPVLGGFNCGYGAAELRSAAGAGLWTFCSVALLGWLSLNTAQPTPTVIFLLAGQSNMLGQGAVRDLPPAYATPAASSVIWQDGQWRELACRISGSGLLGSQWVVPDRSLVAKRERVSLNRARQEPESCTSLHA
jgi:hypothetical protein